MGYNRMRTQLMTMATMAATVMATVVEIDNARPRRDRHGNILNAHDGTLFQHPLSRRYYLVGTSYTHCFMNSSTERFGATGKHFPNNPLSIPFAPACGFTNNDLALYSNEGPGNDGWTLENPSLLPADQRPNGVYFRPKMLYNALTGLFVLWFNFVALTLDDHKYCAANVSWPMMNFTSPFCNCTLGTATARSVDGPFSLSKLPIAMGTSALQQYPGHLHGDFALFEDTHHAQAYIVYNTYDKGIATSRNAVDLLSPDYQTSTMQTSGYIEDDCHGAEAQAMVRRRGTYYVVSGRGCCFCPQGSSAMVHTAASPLGPYVSTGTNINGVTRRASCDAAAHAIPAQQSFIVRLPDTSMGEEQWLWAGDRWQSGNERINGGNRSGDGMGLKSADAMVWVRMEFTPDGADIKPLPHAWQTIWAVEIPQVAQ